MSSVSEPGTEGSNSQKAHCEQSRSVQRCGKGQCWYSAQKVKWQQTYVWQCHKVTILSGVKTSWVTKIALRELHSDTLWVALSFKVCEWVRHPWDLSRSSICSIYKGINALYWPRIINYQLLPPHSVLYCPVLKIWFGPPNADFWSVWSSQKARKFRQIRLTTKVRILCFEWSVYVSRHETCYVVITWIMKSRQWHKH